MAQCLLGSFLAADALLALLADSETAADSLLSTVLGITSLAVALVVRNGDSIQIASSQVSSARSALLARKVRVLGAVKLLSCKQWKMFFANFEAAAVSAEQLQVWAALADFSDLNVVASLLAGCPRQKEAPNIGICLNTAPLFVSKLGSVPVGDGLHVVSAAGPGLKWFEPHSCSMFNVVLAQADGSSPLWMTAGDVDVTAISSTGILVTGNATLTATDSGTGSVRVVFNGLWSDAAEVVLQLSVCGVTVADADGVCEWSMRVLRRPFGDHSCVAVGEHVRTVAVAAGFKRGMAVSADEQWLVVGLRSVGTLSVYSLPGGELVRSFGDVGDGPLQFKYVERLCFAPNGHLIVVEAYNNRLQEVTLDGVFVRFIGTGDFGRARPFSVAAHDDVIAVGCERSTGPRVVLFYFGTAAVTSCFGEVGTAPGQLSQRCAGIRFTPAGSHVIIAEDHAKRLSLFTTAGVFVKCVGVDVLGEGAKDVLQSAKGECVVADYDNHRVCVFSPNGSELVRSFGVRGTSDGQFVNPASLAAAGQYLYVMEDELGRVQVFQ